MTILVTGGAGFIGAHTVRALQRQNMPVVVLDNLVYGHADFVDKLGVPLVEGQVGQRALLDELLRGDHPATSGDAITGVMHFAAYTDPRESVLQPERFYRNNFGDTLVLCEALLEESRRRDGIPLPLVFSSTCATYGIPEPDQVPIKESCEQHPLNPYGRGKWMVEQLLQDLERAHGLPSVVFRYFNAAGAHPDGDLGEDHDTETHLIPLLLDVMGGRKPFLQIYGDDYPTPDGTCIRDYIHVCDLADAHAMGMQLLLAGQGGYHVYNLGTGTGYSVREVIEVAKHTTKRGLLAHVAPRRTGDPPVLVACSEKAQRELGWRPNYPDLTTMIGHAWGWHQHRYGSR
jgi:UDP-glucose 4-epimerase